MASVISKILAQQEQKELERTKVEFENLKDGEFEKTSNSTPKYNCIAYAAEETHRKWWPVPYAMVGSDVYWPEGVSKVCSRKNFVLAFETLGYKPCENVEIEDGYEKVAIYVTAKASPGTLKGVPLHIAKQLPSGEWTSKLGDFIDIRHKTLEGMEGKKYGVVKQILKRPKKIEMKQEETKNNEKNDDFENFRNLAQNLVSVSNSDVKQAINEAKKKKSAKSKPLKSSETN